MNSKTNLISVIIPTWNRADSIEKAINSVLSQTVSFIELLICDDGSTDKTAEIVKSINDSRVKWVEGSRGGRPAIPRNRGIKACCGEWIAFLDSDDEWLPDKLEKQLKIAERLGCKAVSSNAYRFIPGKGLEGHLLTWDKQLILFDNLLKANQVVCSSALVHRSLFELIEGFPENPDVIEDYGLWLRVATQTDIAYLDEPLVIYRDDAANSVRGEVLNNFWEQQRYVFDDFLIWASKQEVKSEFKEKVNKARRISMIKGVISKCISSVTSRARG